MRTIKFRAKIKAESFELKLAMLDKPNSEGEWVCGDLHICDTKIPHIHCMMNKYPIDVSTIGQYTGLKDKNDKEIYEGDIIGCHNPDIKHLIFYNEKQGRFMAALNGDIENDFVGVCGLDDSRWNASKEVIGNIHDNPELLKIESYETETEND